MQVEIIFYFIEQNTWVYGLKLYICKIFTK